MIQNSQIQDDDNLKGFTFYAEPLLVSKTNKVPGASGKTSRLVNWVLFAARFILNHLDT